MLPLYVRIAGGEQHALELPIDATVGHIHESIKELGYAAGELSFSGQVLRDPTLPLADAGVTSESVIEFAAGGLHWRLDKMFNAVHGESEQELRVTATPCQAYGMPCSGQAFFRKSCGLNMWVGLMPAEGHMLTNKGVTNGGTIVVDSDRGTAGWGLMWNSSSSVHAIGGGTDLVDQSGDERIGWTNKDVVGMVATPEHVKLIKNGKCVGVVPAARLRHDGQQLGLAVAPSCVAINASSAKVTLVPLSDTGWAGP
eukprot:TRINITY_DN33757_c0_g1_i1.p1 TRINITY_DN33757_c0_g1~~TRINITY_DN33757_c0_g1_i1.p1  ORF type:complete len:277 (+),score=47.58 TRINITY_DN33757_c0_g1_i1:69-833(+)